MFLMISHIAGGLQSRRTSLQEKEKGFTLIELLVVIVIIGILAAIAIPVYMNVQNNAKDSAVQSDLTNAKTAVISVQTTSGTLPASNVNIALIPLTAQDGYTKSASTGTITYLVTGSSFCIAAESVTGSEFFVTDTGGVVKVDAVNTLPLTCTAPAFP
jgi:type IV pilus assembly protein PilA